MRASMIVFAGALFTVSAFAADAPVVRSEQRVVVASADAKQVKKAPKAAKTAPVRVWSLEMSCCEPQ
ncbi:MAG TPA: hypothetical protein VMS53_00675 [Burkholderiales bacterium]|jgi:hypothetical protein|nr:hypothetical protein [Burkholderiales bacterium]